MSKKAMKDARRAARAAREEKEAKNVVKIILGGLVVLALAILLYASFGV